MAEKIIATMDYDSLKDLFVKSGLEIHMEDPAPARLITCYKLYDEETGERLGAAGLAYCEDMREEMIRSGESLADEFVLRCVAVEEEHRGKGYGIQLVQRVMDDAKEMGAKRIWLTGKVPEFYKKFGFEIVSRDTAPFKTKCGECPQYHNGCESEVMVYYY